MKSLRILAALALSLPAFAHHGGGAGAGTGGQLTFSPDTMGAWKVYLGLRGDATNGRNLSDSQLRRAAEHGHMLHVSDWEEEYAIDGELGLADFLSVGLSVAYHRMDDCREAEMCEDCGMGGMGGMGEAEVTTSHPSGLADLPVWAKLRILKVGGFQAAIRAGVELPTGKWDYRSPDGELMEPSHQPGSGSLDFFGDVAVGYGSGSWAVQVAASAMIHTMGVRRYEIGDRYRLGAGGGYRVLGDGKAFGLSVTLDAWVDWSTRDIDHGRRMRDSGGWDASVAPGVRIQVGPVMAQVAVPLQFWNTIREEAGQDYRIIASIGVSF